MNINFVSRILTALVLSALVLIKANAYCQPYFDSLNIDLLLLNAKEKDGLVTTDSRVIKCIQAVDEHIDSLVRHSSTYSPKRFTVIQNSQIRIRRLVSRDSALAVIINDTASKSMVDYWKSMSHDTLKFLTDQFIKDSYELYYPSYQYPKEISIICPSKIKDSLNLKHLIFYTSELNSLIASAAKKISKVQKKAFYNYLLQNFDHFSFKQKKVQAKAIAIKTITFSPNITYVGIDFYGSHYLLSFDLNQDWRLVEAKELWLH